MNITCDKCGAIYMLVESHLPVKDDDSIQCKYCKTTLKSWRKSTTVYSTMEISGPTKNY